MKDQHPLVSHYEAAKQNLNKGKTKQAMKEFREALNNRPSLGDNKDDWNNYYSVKIQFGAVLKKQGELLQKNDIIVEANSIFSQVIKDFKGLDIEDKLTAENQQELEYSLFQNYAKLLLYLSDENRNNNYDKYRQKMTSSHRYFRKSQNIVISRLLKQIEVQGAITQSKWVERYLKQVSNMMEGQIIEGEEFDDKRCFDQILKATDHVKKVYDYNKNKEKIVNQMQSHLHRCYYYKALVLRLTGQLDPSFQLFLKVRQFQQRNNQKEDAEKTRGELLKYHMSKNKMKEAFQLIKSGGEKEHLQQVQARREKIKKMFNAPQKQIKKYTPQILDNLFADFNDQYDHYLYDYDKMDLLLSQNLHLFDHNPQMKALVHYYISQANFRMKKYDKSLKSIKDALQIQNIDPFDKRDWKMEQIKIRGSINCQDIELNPIIEKLREELRIEEGKNQNSSFLQLLLNQKRELQKIVNHLSKKRKKKNDVVVYNILQDNDQKLLAQLKKISIREAEKQKFANPILHELKSLKDPSQRSHLSSEERRSITIGQMKSKQKINFLNPEQEYAKLCKEKKIVQRKQITQLLSQNKSDFNPFQNFLNLSAEELQLFLSFVKVTNLDLRTHRIEQNDMTLSTILNKVNLQQIKQFKINGTNIFSHQMLRTIISKMSQVNYLSFVDFTVVKPRPFYLLQNMHIQNQRMNEQSQPRSVVHVLSLLTRENQSFSVQNLKILKLKYCNLMDDHLLEMRIRCYCNLEQLSLSHNFLEGKHFQEFMTLKNIYKVNVSDNPLHSFSFDSWKGKYTDSSVRLQSLKVRNVVLNSLFIEELRSVLLRVVEVDFSQCQNVGLLVKALYENWRQDKQLVFLEKLIAKNINLNQINPYFLVHVSANIRQIDLLGCKFSKETKENLLNYKYEQLNLNITISQQVQQRDTFDRFSLGQF